MQKKIDQFNALFLNMAACYVERVIGKTKEKEPEARGAAQQFRYELADEVRLANLLAVTVGKMWDRMAQEPPQDGAEPVELGPGMVFKMGRAEPVRIDLTPEQAAKVDQALRGVGLFKLDAVAAQEAAKMKEVHINATPDQGEELRRMMQEAGPGTIVNFAEEEAPPGAWEILWNILTGKLKAPEGCAFNINVNVENGPQEVTVKTADSVPDKQQETE